MTGYSLVADVGGTNARFALVADGSIELEHIKTLPCADFSNIDEACRAYFEMTAVSSVERACLAFACPVSGEEIRMTNNHWRFTRKQLAGSLGLKTLKLVNDFTAMALGMLFVDETERVAVGGQVDSNGDCRLVIGPGTGLGVSGLVRSGDYWVPLAAEGGHISFAPTSELEVKIWRELTNRYGRVSVERILSGQGLLDLYQVMCGIRNSQPVCATPAEVSLMGAKGDEPVAEETLQIFCQILGSVAGDNSLTLGATGGVYLCGGILPKIQTFFLASDFRQAFEDKGRFRQYMQNIPVWLCTAEYPGLVGAAAALNNPEVKG